MVTWGGTDRPEHYKPPTLVGGAWNKVSLAWYIKSQQ